MADTRADTRNGSYRYEYECQLAVRGGKPVRETWLPYGHQSISQSDIDAVVNVIQSDWLTQGPQIQHFEDVLASCVGARHAVIFSSGTAALHAAYFAAGIGAGDEIVTSAMTFAATANAALYLGAIPKFADIDLTTGNIKPELAESLISKRTKAIVGVDYAGHPCDIDELKLLAKKHGLLFLQDAAHALGAFYKGQPIGSLADMTVFSFHPVKAITTGEGGAVVTNNSNFARKLKNFRTHGIEKDLSLLEDQTAIAPWYHEMQFLGYNYRLTDIQAALGASQLKSLPEFVARRRQIAAKYRELLPALEFVECLAEKSFVQAAYHLFPILLSNNENIPELRKQIVMALHAENIGVQVHYIPVYQHPHYKRLFGDLRATCPNTEKFYERVLSLPIFPRMTDEDINDVVAALLKVGNYLF